MSPLPDTTLPLQPDVALDLASMVPERDVLFYLYTRTNPEEPMMLKIGDAATLENSTFNGSAPTKVLIHGWTDSASIPWVQDFRRNYLHAGDCNVIVIDWSPGASREYLTASKLTRQVGDYISQLLDFLVSESQLTLDRVHILGHSLGAHIAGFVGSNESGGVGRITGMDPARPDYEVPIYRDSRDRLDAGDARFVDVIHTCAGTAGFVRPVGHADFYPNGGTFRQPGCPVLMTQYCSHGRSHQFMSESVINPRGFLAIECASWRDFKATRCDGDEVVYMGEELSPSARGVYFLETNVETPFGKGEL